MRSPIKQNKDWKETRTAMVPMIVKKVNDIKLEALFATCLSCAKYTIDNLNQASGSNDVLFKLADTVHKHFIKGNRYSTKDAKQINKLLSETFNPILMSGHNPSSLLIVILDYLFIEVGYKGNIALSLSHNTNRIKGMRLSLEYHYYNHYKHSINILLCLLGEMELSEMIEQRDNPNKEVKSISKNNLALIIEKDTFELQWVNKSLVNLFSLENELGIDFENYLGTKIDSITFNINLLEEFKEFIKLNNDLKENKELIYLKDKLGV